MKATACYIRISTTSQNEASQRREIERWLNGHGITNVVWFVDKRTGDNLRRPGLERLQKAVFNGEIGTIVCWKLDRISRDLRDGINTLCGWLKAGVRVVSVTQALDLSTDCGQLIASVLFACAQMEQSTRRERQAAGIAAVMADPDLRAKKYSGRAKESYKADRDKALALKAKGREPAEIAKLLDISRATAYRYLSAAV